MAEHSQKQIDKAVKALHALAGKADPPEKLPSETKFAEKMGEPKTPALIQLMWAAEPVAYPSFKVSTNAKAIAKARTNGVRVERLMARTGLSRSEVLAKIEEGGVDPKAYVGRGRRFDGSAAATTSGSTSGRGSSGSGRGATSGRGTSGRRAANASAGRGRGARATASDPK